MPRSRRLVIFVCALACACKAESEPMQAPSAAPESAAAPAGDAVAMPEPEASEEEARKPSRADDKAKDQADGAAAGPPPATPTKTRDAALADETTAIAGIGDAEPIIQGNLDRDIIRRVVRDHSDEVQACYDEARRKNPNVQGTITVEFTIDKRGQVSNSSTDEDLDDAKLAECLSKVVSDWEFPKPGKGEVVVNYPFTLTPGGR